MFFSSGMLNRELLTEYHSVHKHCRPPELARNSGVEAARRMWVPGLGSRLGSATYRQCAEQVMAAGVSETPFRTVMVESEMLRA